MRHTTFARVGAAALALALGGLLAALAPATSAGAQIPPPPPPPPPVSMPLVLDVEVESPGTLVASGVAVDVPITINCSARDAFVSLTLTQRVGSRIAQGFGGTSVACVGQTQRLLIRITASSGGPAFRARPALADASAFACTDEFCFEDRDSEVIDIRR